MGVADLKMWPKGVSGNPGGRPKLPEELRLIKALSQNEVCRMISKYARMDMDTLEAHLERRDIPVIDLAMCSIFKESVEKGDFTRLAFLLDRAIGKVKDIIDDDDTQSEREKLKQLSLNELLALVKTNLPESEAV